MIPRAQQRDQVSRSATLDAFPLLLGAVGWHEMGQRLNPARGSLWRRVGEELTWLIGLKFLILNFPLNISPRALKTRGNTPKYGLIFHSTFIGRAAAKNKGRISRYLANKCSIASRIDCFSGMARGVGVWEWGAECLSSFYNDGNIFRQQQFT